MRLSPKTLVLFGIVALPVGLLMLAKLFDSAVLGWMFGLTLMAGMAMLPLVVIGYGGYRLVRWIVGRSRQHAGTPAESSIRTVQVERGSVHASDDAPSRQITVPAGCALREVVAEASADGYLPRISGGRATWVVESTSADGPGFTPIAVWSQQWREPTFVSDPDQPAASHFGSASPSLRFRYRCQDDPDGVLKELIANDRS